MTKKLFVLALLSATLASCKHEGHVKNNEWNAHKAQFQMEFSEMVRFELDSETSPFSMCIQFIDMNGQSRLITLNGYDNSLRVFDAETKTQIQKIPYEKQGADGVGAIQGFLYINSDSIFVYTYWGRTLYLTNDQGKVLDKYPFSDSDDMDYNIPAPFIQTASPMRKINDEIIINGFIADESASEEAINRKITTFYNIKTRQISHANKYPEQYAKYNWAGGLFYRLVPYTVNTNNEIILSFPAEHYLHVFSLDDKDIRRYYAGSSLIRKITSINAPKEYEVESDMEWNWYLQNPSYESVLHDPYQNVYYRIARLPNKGNKNLENLITPKPLVVIILNDKIEYIGESSLPENIDFISNNCFVTQDGFHIQVHKTDTEEDENYMTFYRYKMGKK